MCCQHPLQNVVLDVLILRLIERALFRLALGFGSAFGSALTLRLGFLRLPFNAFRKFGGSCLAIPFFKSLVRDLSFDQKFSKLSSLRFAFEWHLFSAI
jgi:hypothetical protein